MDPNTITFSKSSNIQSAKFDPATGIAEVLFANNKTYRYANFTPAMMVDWQAAKSAGSWFHANVRQQPDKFPLVPTGAAAPTPPPAELDEDKPDAPAASPAATLSPPPPPPSAAPSPRPARARGRKDGPWSDRPWRTNAEKLAKRSAPKT